MLEHGIQSLCCIPLTTRKGELGTLNLASEDAHAFAMNWCWLVRQRASWRGCSLSCSVGRERDGGASEVRIRSSLTHEEIAQMIGSSRETVTRLLSELKKKELIRLEGSILVIRNRTALEAMAV
jgi:hypothetical protein